MTLVQKFCFQRQNISPRALYELGVYNDAFVSMETSSSCPGALGVSVLLHCYRQGCWMLAVSFLRVLLGTVKDFPIP